MAAILDTKAIAAYTFGSSREVLTAAADAIRSALADTARRTAVNNDLLEILSGDATTDAKDFACRQLWISGDAAAVPALANLLKDVKTADMARYALEKMECPEAGAALRDALGTAPSEVKAGIINSLAMRREENAVREIAKMTKNSDGSIAAAALDALARIATPQSLRRLEGAELASGLEPERDHALLFAAEQLAKNANKAAAREVYQNLSTEAHPEIIRAAALRGLSGLEDDTAQRNTHEEAARKLTRRKAK